MPLQATSGAASYDAFGGGVAAVPQYIEDVFGTFLYTGNGSTQTITNGIDLADKGGMVWWKNRTNATGHGLIDTTRGIDYYLSSNTTDAQDGPVSYISSVSSTGYSIGAGTQFVNQSANNYASWTFRKAPKFFDVVTYTGTGSPVTVNHNLGSTPGCIIIKATSNAQNWYVWHRSAVDIYGNGYLILNSTAAVAGGPLIDSVSSTNFVVSSGASDVGYTYVCYVFAHDAGGFGLTGTDNVISCGSYTGNGSTDGPVINLGYEPQWLLIKSSSASSTAWTLIDNMRGMTVGGADAYLKPNSSDAETTSLDLLSPTATGFKLTSTLGLVNGANDYIYIAIRRGPMKVPTSGTSVFAPVLATTPSSPYTATTNFPVDLLISSATVASGKDAMDRLRGGTTTSFRTLFTNTTDAESVATGFGIGFQSNTSIIDNAYWSGNGVNIIYWNFRRAPSFFDEVCYTGDGANNRTVTTNLGVAAELIICKCRGTAGVNGFVAIPSISSGYLVLDATTSIADVGTNYFASSSTNISFPVSASQNTNTRTYVAYLFATCAGVSKVFSYTGNGSSQTINCGFTGGARFVLIKRTDSTGDWYVWDSARGIVSGNDPHLSLNTTDAEVTTDDTIDTDSTGFVVNQVSATNVNVSSATYIGLAIA